MAVVVGEIDIDVEIGRDGNKVVAVEGKTTDLSYYKGEASKYMQHYFRRYIHNTEYYVAGRLGASRMR